MVLLLPKKSSTLLEVVKRPCAEGQVYCSPQLKWKRSSIAVDVLPNWSGCGLQLKWMWSLIEVGVVFNWSGCGLKLKWKCLSRDVAGAINWCKSSCGLKWTWFSTEVEVELSSAEMDVLPNWSGSGHQEKWQGLSIDIKAHHDLKWNVVLNWSGSGTQLSWSGGATKFEVEVVINRCGRGYQLI